MSKPIVSVIVPIYNVDPYLRQCLDTLVAQTLADIEILTIDDGSTDESGAIADEFAARDKRIRVIHKPNSGYGDSMNQGLEAARGDWIAICEPDDYVEPAMCEHLLTCAERFSGDNSPIDIVKASYTRIVQDEAGRISRLPGALQGEITPPHQPFSIDECPLLLTAHPSIWTALYRKEFLDEFGIRFLPIPGAGWADNPFFLETMIAARRIAYLDEPVYNYREFEDGTTSHLKDWRIIVDRWADMENVLDAYDVEVPAILEAHYVRGCAYLQMLHEDFDLDDPAFASAADAIAASLDFDLVRRSSLISKERKLAYARHLPASKKWRLFTSWVGLHTRSIFS